MSPPCDLHRFPRPPRDTGYGLHWCPGLSLLSREQVVEKWLPRLAELGATWVTFTEAREALALAEPLRAAGIMPIVCLERPQPDAPLDPETLALVDDLLRAGVVYLELGRRPDAPQRWPHQIPQDARHRVALALAQDLEAILERGGLPGLPATEPTPEWDLVGALLDLGREDLLAGPVWQAVHNRPGNRPPDYPHDPVNQDGLPVTPALYRTLAQEGGPTDPWQGRTRSQVNALRRREARRGRPGPVGLDTPCWRSYQEVAHTTQARLGRPLPLIATVTGYQVGDATDPRYPAVTPRLHMALTLELCRILMGSSRRYPRAPEFLLAATFWLLAGQAIQSAREVPEEAAWFSPRWPGGHLPVVDALAQEPKLPREAPEVPLPSGEPHAVVVSSGSPAGRPNRRATLHGHVRGGSGAVLYLVRADGLLWRTLARADGSYRFVDLDPGLYTVWVHEPRGSRQPRIELRGGESARVDLRVDGWGHERVPDPSGPDAHLECWVELPAHALREGMPALRVSRPGEEPRVVPMVRQSGRREAMGTVGPLSPTTYRVELIGLTDPYAADGSAAPLQVKVAVPARGTIRLRFVFSSPSPRWPRRSTVVAQVRPAGAEQAVVLVDEREEMRRAVTDAEGTVAFADLPPGAYALHLAEAPQVGRPRLGLDGENTVAAILELPPEMCPPPRAPRGEIVCQVEDARVQEASLLGEDGVAWTQRLEQGKTVFGRLRPGVYTLVAGLHVQPGLRVRPDQRTVVTFPNPGPGWTVDQRTQERAAGEKDAALVVEVPGRRGWPVRVHSPDGAVRQGVIGEDQARPWLWTAHGLSPGTYRVEVFGIPVAARVTLAPGRVVWVAFRRLLSPPPPRIQTSPLM